MIYDPQTKPVQSSAWFLHQRLVSLKTAIFLPITFTRSGSLTPALNDKGAG
jgi:hypothetical protein